MVAWRAALVLVPLSLACSPVERNFTSSSGQSSASHMGGASSSTASHMGGAGGSGAGTAAGGGGGLTEAQACADYAAKICARNETCAPDVLTYQYGDVATCKQRYALFCSILLPPKAPHTAWTPKQLADCGDALANLACPEYLLAPFTGGPSACHPKAGTVADGASCIDAGQCQTAYCKHNGASACGVCTKLVGNGAPCDTPFDCKSGLACAGPSGSKTCITAKQQGQSCVGNGDCDFGVACQGGICKPALAEGSPCDPNTLCDPLQGLYCNSASNVCARASYANAGEACGPETPPDGGTPGLVGCKAAALCHAASPPLCIAPGADGAACDLSMGIGCMNPAACVAGTCTVPDQSNCP